VLEVIPGARPRFYAGGASTEPGAPVRFVLNTSFARQLLGDPDLAHRRYAVP
jgi:hypothetical protein